MTEDFLVEIGTEELPPTALKHLSNSFADSIDSQLKALQLGFTKLDTFATPRRLAVRVHALDKQTASQEVVNWGPPKSVAFDDSGQPTKAALAFAKKNSINVDSLTIDNDGKADKLVHRCKKPGNATVELLPSIVQHALDKLPIPKRMRWGSHRTEFVRPVHWLVLMFGSTIVDTNILGKRSNNMTRGHRFHCDTTLEIANPQVYPSMLTDSGHVIASFDERKELIRQQVVSEGKKLGGAAVIDEDLLDEVTGLVEWPVALAGSFDSKFLQVPSEALIYSMKEHQKYFHVVDDDNKLIPYFITVSNIDSAQPQQIISGNERVIRPRLSDAAFFYESDKKTSLAQRVEQLSSVVFQHQLGTVLDKSARIKSLAVYIADQIGGNSKYAARAGQLCKADLLTDMVLEFDKMQGIAGYYYALHDGEAAEVAEAIKEHYLPKFAADSLPGSKTSCALALADRLDTIVGIFGIGQKPSGSKDPFALRRASLAVLRILVEKGFDLDLKALLAQAAQYHGDNVANAESAVKDALEYMIERFRARYEEQEIAAEIFMAVSAKELSCPLDIDQRVKAVHYFSQLPQAQALATANKRVSNILSKQEQTSDTKLDFSLLAEDAEIKLAELVEHKSKEVTPLFQQRQYKEALTILAELRQAVDEFFDSVMVMTDDLAVQNNRLMLLRRLRHLFLQVADISLLVPSK